MIKTTTLEWRWGLRLSKTSSFFCTRQRTHAGIMCPHWDDEIQHVPSAVVSSRWFQLQAGQSVQAYLYCRSCFTVLVHRVDSGDADQRIRYSCKFAPALAARTQCSGHVRFALEIPLYVRLVLEIPL